MLMSSLKVLLASAALLGLSACSNELKVTGVEPNSGTYGGGEEVVIQGNGFQPGRGGVVVKFGTRPATAVVVAAGDKINVTTPAGDKNTSVDVVVIFDDGKAFKLANGFHFLEGGQGRQTLDKAFNQMGTKKP
jgi:hypothetical protein